MKWPMWSPDHYADIPIKRLRELEKKLDEIAKWSKDEIIKKRIEVLKLWVSYCALAKESEYHIKITRDKEKGKEVEQKIKNLFKENKEFLARTGLLTEGDIEFLAEKVTDFNLSVYFSGK
jgi:S-methylmethionine-dependent homocysteine/selenocysteine methylase